MMLIVLDENPYEAAKKVPQKVQHTQLKELMQMISCVVDFGYKQLPQGKVLKDWINKYLDWTYVYAKTLVEKQYKSLKEETRIKYQALLDLLLLNCKHIIVPNAETAIFRYVKEYEGNTEYSTDIELPIDVAIEEYKKYSEWKGNKWH